MTYQGCGSGPRVCHHFSQAWRTILRERPASLLTSSLLYSTLFSLPSYFNFTASDAVILSAAGAKDLLFAKADPSLRARSARSAQSLP